MRGFTPGAAVLLHNIDPFPHGPKRLVVRGNQALFERGVRPPWIWDEQRCRTFWATRVNDGDANAPAGYATKPQEIVEFLHDFWQPFVLPDMRILEVGCNAGANLHGLRARGYRRLSAVEINPTAVAQLRRSFPELADVDVAEGALEQVLPTIEPVDVVFSMAVLLHVHPASAAVFAEIARIGSYICVIEDEIRTVGHAFARNYRRVFERLGCAQIRSVRLTEAAVPGLDAAYNGYTARLFRRL